MSVRVYVLHTPKVSMLFESSWVLPICGTCLSQITLLLCLWCHLGSAHQLSPTHGFLMRSLVYLEKDLSFIMVMCVSVCICLCECRCTETGAGVTGSCVPPDISQQPPLTSFLQANYSPVCGLLWCHMIDTNLFSEE